MNTYKTSTGERFTQSQIDAKIREAKKSALERQFDMIGFNCCEKCGNNGSNTRLDCSHDISVDRAKKNGETEKCWDVKNIKILCRNCHKTKDGLNLQFSNNLK